MIGHIGAFEKNFKNFIIQTSIRPMVGHIGAFEKNFKNFMMET